MFSIKGLASLAEAAANAEALESQFSQVFGNMEDAASDSLSNIAKDTGVAVNRMKGSFMQIAAFAKTSGMDSEQALGLTERAMSAVADSAAFYDKSLEQVTDSLQSFLKGNYANDAALGLSATETTRNAAANELYGKSFKDLAEDQKQLTLLSMVENANKLSGAIGQAARESDTWGSQLGNLKQGLKDLQTAVGGVILKPMIQLLKIAALLIGKLTEAAKDLTKEGSFLNRMGEKLTNWLKRAQVWLERVIQKVGGAKNALELLTMAAGAILLALNVDKVLGFFKSLSGALNLAKLKTLALAAVFLLIALAVEDFVNFMQGNDSVIGTLLERWGIDADGVRQKFKDAWTNIKNTLIKVWNTIQTAARRVWGAMTSWWEKNGRDVAYSLKSIWDSLCKILSEVWENLQTTASAIFDALGINAENWGTVVDGVVNGILDILALLLSTLADLLAFVEDIFRGDFAGAWEDIKSAVGGVVDFLVDKFGAVGIAIVAITTAVAAYKVVQFAMNSVTAIQTALTNGATVAAIAQTVAQKAAAAAQWLLNAAMSANPIGLIAALIAGLIVAFIALWNNNEDFRNFFINMWETIKTAFDAVVEWFKGAIDAAGAAFSAAGEWIKDAWQAVADWFDTAIQAIIGFFEPFTDAIKRIFGGVIDFFTGVFSGDFSKAWDGIKDIFGGIADWFKTIIDKIVGFFKPLTDAISGIGSWISNLFGGGGKKQVQVDVQGEAPKADSGSTPKYAKGTSNAANTALVGENGPELVTGIKGAKVFTSDKTREMLEGLAAFARGAFASPETAQASSARNINITQNITIDNTFNGDKAGQKQSSGAMSRAAQDTTAELARGLAYAR